jgi:hypothetical protein
VSGCAALLDGEKQYFSLPHSSTGDLNIHGAGAEVTVVAWIRWDRVQSGFIGGIWQEHNRDPRRQYGLFVHLPVYGGDRNVCGHVSLLGGSSPGLPYSRDYSANSSPVPLGEWTVAAFSYDGREVRSFLNGVFEPRATYTEAGPPMGEGLSYAKNPYSWPHGLGDNAGDFTVGAVQLTAGMGNFFAGAIGGLAVYSRALDATELTKLQPKNFDYPDGTLSVDI